jgi:hypothetical protein
MPTTDSQPTSRTRTTPNAIQGQRWVLALTSLDALAPWTKCRSGWRRSGALG